MTIGLGENELRMGSSWEIYRQQAQNSPIFSSAREPIETDLKPQAIPDSQSLGEVRPLRIRPSEFTANMDAEAFSKFWEGSRDTRVWPEDPADQVVQSTDSDAITIVDQAPREVFDGQKEDFFLRKIADDAETLRKYHLVFSLRHALIPRIAEFVTQPSEDRDPIQRELIHLLMARLDVLEDDPLFRI